MSRRCDMRGPLKQVNDCLIDKAVKNIMDVFIEKVYASYFSVGLLTFGGET